MAPRRGEPLLGEAWLRTQTGPPPRTPGDVADLSPTLCQDASAFGLLLRQYRALDDSVVLRLNRHQALNRSRVTGLDAGKRTEAQQACSRFWKELMDNWTGREEVIKYCVGVMDATVTAKAASFAPQPASSDSPASTLLRPPISSAPPTISRPPDPTLADPLTETQRRRSLESAVYGTELRRRMIHDELAVESIIRRRTLQTFTSRCPAGVFERPVGGPGVELEVLPEPKRHWKD